MSIVTKLIDDYKANRISWNRLADALANRDYDPPAHHRNMTYEAIESVDRFADGTTGEIHKAYCEGRLTRSEYNAICDAILATHPKPVAAPPLGMVKAEIWDPAKHPRGQPDNAGEFGPGGGSPSPANITSPLLEPYNPSLIFPQYEMAYVSPNGQGGPRDNPQATTLAGLDPLFQERVLNTLLTESPNKDLTPALLREHARHVLQHALDNDPVAVAAKDWYVTAQGVGFDVARIAGRDDRTGIAMLAALSPQTDWYSNLTVARFVATKLAADEIPNLTTREINAINKKALHTRSKSMRVKIPSNKKLSEMEPAQAAWALMGMAKKEKLMTEALTLEGKPRKAQLSMGSLNVAKAVQLYRGAEPGDILRGHKVRSFFNNISDPLNTQGRNDVTVDTHMVSALTLMRIGGKDPIMKKMFQGGSNVKSNAEGTYALFADAIRDIAQEYHLLPNQAQAIIWTHWQTVKGAGKWGHLGYRESFPAYGDDPDSEEGGEDEL